MKAVKLLAIAALVAAPVLSFAQTSQNVTRAQVRAELVQLQQAGYNPASDQTQYPTNIQAALARIHANDSTAFGGAANSVSQSGAHRVASNQDDVPGLGPVFAHP
jgi:type II secretory pathway pseudopilin PulG